MAGGRTRRGTRLRIGVATVAAVAILVVGMVRRRRSPLHHRARWASGTGVRWNAAPFVMFGPDGERCEVRAGDVGRVVFDDSPVEFCVAFPTTGVFCTERSSVELLTGEASLDGGPVR